MKGKNKKRIGWIIGILILVLVGLRLALEPIAVYFVNKALAELDGYQGKVDDIDIALYRGAYRLDSLMIEKIDGDFPEPFVNIPHTDISVEWAALFKGSIVGEIILENPTLNFTFNSSGDAQSGENENWLETVDALVPIRINRFEIKNGSITYNDYSVQPHVKIKVSHLQALATNLSTISDKKKKLPSRIVATANTSGTGDLNLDMGINVLKTSPDFDMNLSIEDIDLPFLNDFTEAYANFTFKEGTMDVFTEVAMEDGKFKGYVKPILRNTKVIDLDNPSANFWRKAWEVVVGTTLKLFQNQKEEQFATEVPFSGTTQTSEVGILATIGNVLRNAFIEAFDAQIDDKVSIENVKEENEKKGLFDFLKKKD